MLIYRGYVLISTAQITSIWYDSELIDTLFGSSSLKDARKIIDNWHNAL